MEEKPQDIGHGFSSQREYILKQNSFNVEMRRRMCTVLLFINSPLHTNPTYVFFSFIVLGDWPSRSVKNLFSV